jgi:hypothetical protein
MGANEELVLVAPFLKATVLKRLVGALSQTAHVTVITRWRPEEVARGVSDPEAWDVVRNRPEAKFLLSPNLHAKYYRGDDRCLVGSANLTQRALGWCSNPNLEILVDQHYEVGGSLALFEQLVTADSVPASDLLQRLVVESAAQIPVLEPLTPAVATLPCVDADYPSQWLPQSRAPSAVWRLYSEGPDSMPVTAAEAAATDLAYLRPPSGLSSEGFVVFVRAALLQVPIVSQLDELVAVPQRFGAVVAFLKQAGYGDQGERNPDIVWQSLMRWLLHFYPERYERRVPRHSEVFGRRPW